MPNLNGCAYQMQGIGNNGQIVLDSKPLPGTAYTAPYDGLLMLIVAGSYAENYNITIYNPDGNIFFGGHREDDVQGNTQQTTFYIPLVKGARVDVTSASTATASRIIMQSSRFYPYKTYPIFGHIIKY